MARAEDFARLDEYRRVGVESANPAEASIARLAVKFLSGLTAFIGLSLMIASLAGA